jgi:hypothetical protein
LVFISRPLLLDLSLALLQVGAKVAGVFRTLRCCISISRMRVTVWPRNVRSCEMISAAQGQAFNQSPAIPALQYQDG